MLTQETGSLLNDAGVKDKSAAVIVIFLALLGRVDQLWKDMEGESNEEDCRAALCDPL